MQEVPDFREHYRPEQEAEVRKENACALEDQRMMFNLAFVYATILGSDPYLRFSSM